jgi:hypothetical protein
MKSAMPGQPSFLDYGKLRGNRTPAKTFLNSLALVTIPLLIAALAQRQDAGTETFSKTTVNARESTT